MRNEMSENLEKGFLGSLAKVSKNKTRKEMLLTMVEEALSAVDMAKGLRGKGDWRGAAAKVLACAGLVDQAVDLAETLPGVKMDRTRRQAELVGKRLRDSVNELDSDADRVRSLILECEKAAHKAIMAIGLFAQGLRDIRVNKAGFSVEFSEDDLIKSLNGKVEKKKPKLGSGKRFDELVEELRGKPGVKNPKAVAAWIGRKKWGKKRFQEMAAAGKSLDEILHSLCEENESVPGFEIEKTRKGRKVKPGSLKGGKSEPSAKAPPGEGARFEALEDKLRRRGDVKNPAALAASLGRAKYGKKRFQQMAARGRKKG